MQIFFSLKFIITFMPRTEQTWHGGAVVSTEDSKQVGSLFEPASWVEPFCVEVAWFPCSCVGSF